MLLSMIPAGFAADIEIVDAVAPGPDAEIQATVLASGRCGDNLE